MNRVRKECKNYFQKSFLGAIIRHPPRYALSKPTGVKSFEETYGCLKINI